MRTWLTACVVVVFVVAGLAQQRSKTSWGDPDLQGIWSNATLTPLERSAEMKDKEFLTDAEVADIERTGLERTLKPIAIEVAASGELNDRWLELGKVVRSHRTSLVIDPPDGKIPFTPEGKKRRDAALAKLLNLVPSNSFEDRNLAERCLMTGGLLVPNPFYLNNHQIVQNRGHVVIVSEVMRQTRIIPLDGRAPLSSGITQWAGDSRGRWEGETLVIETTNFNEKGGFQAATAGLRLVERFTKVDNQTMDYQLTISDPATFTQAWTLVNTLRKIPGQIYEYGCHEGNYGLPNILSGARAQERARAEKAPSQEKTASAQEGQEKK
jgi:hypothetical protein